MLHTETIQEIYDALFKHYGSCSSLFERPPFEMMLMAYLKEGASRENVEKTLERLCEYTTPDKMTTLWNELLEEHLSLCDSPDVMTLRINALVSRLLTWGYLPEHYAHYSQDELRSLFLHILIAKKSIVDFIMLYAFDYPVLIADEGTQKLLSRIDPDSGWDALEYDALSQAVKECLPEDIGVYKQFHMLVSRLVEEHCADAHPACRTCPLLYMCAKAGEF